MSLGRNILNQTSNERKQQSPQSDDFYIISDLNPFQRSTRYLLANNQRLTLGKWNIFYHFVSIMHFQPFRIRLLLEYLCLMVFMQRKSKSGKYDQHEESCKRFG